MKPIDVLTGGEHSRTIEAKRCTICGGPATEFKDALSAKEYNISGMCQKCQDSFFDEENF